MKVAHVITRLIIGGAQEIETHLPCVFVKQVGCIETIGVIEIAGAINTAVAVR